MRKPLLGFVIALITAAPAFAQTVRTIKCPPGASTCYYVDKPVRLGNEFDRLNELQGMVRQLERNVQRKSDENMWNLQHGR